MAEGAKQPANSPGGQAESLPTATKSARREKAANNSTEIHILVFRGHPVDNHDTRETQIFIAPAGSPRDDEGSLTFQLHGKPQHFEIQSLANQGPLGERPRLLRSIFVTSVPTSSDADVRLRQMVLSTPPNEEWDHRNWVDDVLTSIQAEWLDDITLQQVETALDAMVHTITDWGWGS